MTKRFYIPARRHAGALLDATLCDGLSVANGVLSKWMDGSNLFLAWILLSTYPTPFFWKNSRISKNKSTSFWNFVANSALKFAAASRSSQRVVNLARQRWTLSVIYWINRTVVSQTWVDSTGDGRRPVFHIERPCLSTARYAWGSGS